MSKIRIYIEPESVKDSIEVRDKDTVHKIKDVLRLKSNDSVYVFDGEGREYIYKIHKIDKSKVVLEKERQERQEPAVSKRVVLGFPVLREEKIDFILQKATELGVTGFLPFVSSRSLRIKPSVPKIKRWRKIIIEAVRQSGRLWIPEIGNILEFGKVIRQEFPIKLAASIDGDNPREVLSKNTGDILVIAGPEGDFSPLEYRELEMSGFKLIKLSLYILRTETAAIFAVGLITQMITEKDTDDRR